MKTVTLRNRKVDVPECIDELTADQYGHYIHLSAWLTNGVIDLQKWRALLFCLITNLSFSVYKILKPEYKAEEDNLIPELTEPFLVNGRTPTFDTCVNKLPWYTGYKGPADWLNGLEFGKFVKCATILDQAAVPGSDVRELYEDIARELYSIPADEKVPFILSWHAPVFFGNVWRKIQEGPMMINGKMIDLSIIFKSTGEHRADDMTGWTGVAFEVAAAGVFGNLQELEKTDVWAVLLYLYKCKFEYLNDKTDK